MTDETITRKLAETVAACPSCGKNRPLAVSFATFKPGSVCPHCGHVEPEDDD